MVNVRKCWLIFEFRELHLDNDTKIKLSQAHRPTGLSHTLTWLQSRLTEALFLNVTRANHFGQNLPTLAILALAPNQYKTALTHIQVHPCSHITCTFLFLASTIPRKFTRLPRLTCKRTLLAGLYAVLAASPRAAARTSRNWRELARRVSSGPSS